MSSVQSKQNLLARVAIKLSEIHNFRGRSQEIVDMIAPDASCDAIYIYRQEPDGKYRVVSSYIADPGDNCVAESILVDLPDGISDDLGITAIGLDHLRNLNVYIPMLEAGHYNSVLFYTFLGKFGIQGFMIFCRNDLSTPESWHSRWWFDAIVAMLISSINLTITNEKLSRQLSWRDKIYPIIAHDLRSGVGTMKMLLEAMMQSLPEDPQCQPMVEMIQMADQSAVQTFELLDNLLKWSRMNGGANNFTPQNITVGELLSLRENMYFQALELKQLKFDYDVRDTDTILNVDVEMIRTVLRNLLSNAIKFTPQGGTITLRAMLTDHSTFMFEIGDTGIGLTPEQIEILMLGSQHFTTYGTQGEKGSGLGFSLCRGFVAQHGSKLVITSTPGLGSAFSFELPVV